MTEIPIADPELGEREIERVGGELERDARSSSDAEDERGADAGSETGAASDTEPAES